LRGGRGRAIQGRLTQATAGITPVPELCRNNRQLANTRDNRPGRKFNNHNASVVPTDLVSTRH
jgi:hypothetical protein